ncbi:centrobin [Holotrichia oblita]|uniref:Centrobin n=1 Tax=Holotrichia oblita TaxID=644536 RepID=A0ACB9SXH7_HOLOL|nr:centrobin [Holotrichia oblita]
MSETDDTDELILIPPDFFVTEDLEVPYLSGPYYNVVDSLISQVNHLESRLNLIETKSEYSSAHNSLLDTELMSGIRKYSSSDDINKVIRDGYFESTQSTPQKPQTRFKLGSCASSSTERYSPRKKNIFSPTKVNLNIGKIKENSQNYQRKNEATKEILQEIDQYICSMQNSKENSTKSENISKDTLNLKDLDHMLRKIDQQTHQFDVQDSLRNNLPRQNVNSLDFNTQMKYQRNPLPLHKNTGHVPSTSDISSYNESVNEKTDSISSSSDSTQMTALPTTTNRLHAGGDYNYGQIRSNVNVSQLEHQNYVHSQNKVQDQRDSRNFKQSISQNSKQQQLNSRQDYRLLSLSHLWSRTNETQEYLTTEEKTLQKLEEEKLRRQHCEQLIQHLQSKTLELQEKLAVAMQVDEAKDDAILKFHSSWELVAQRLQVLTQDRNSLEQEIANMQALHAENMLESVKHKFLFCDVDVIDIFFQKINHFENEASKALSLAKTSQDKVKELEAQIATLNTEIISLNSQIQNLECDYKTEKDRNLSLLEQIEQKSRELRETNSALDMVKNEVSNSKKAIDLCQRELSSIRGQNSHLDTLINEKDDIIQSMERHNQKLLSDIDTHKKIEKDLQHELNKTKELNEKNKTDLRNFYQDQVEIVVREKLKEFQSQLDKAESSLQEELKKRELTIAKSAANHIQQIADKHSLEIHLIEEKHNEESRLYQMKLSQAQQHIENLQSRLNSQNQKKTDMVKQLHRVMEAQWLEALKIINNGRSPVVPNDQDVTLNQLNILKTKSQSNLEEMLSMDVTDDQTDKQNKFRESSIIPPLNLAASSSSIQDDHFDHYPYSLNNMETPLSSRPKTKQQIEMELQKYVQLLLNKQPGNPVDNTSPNYNQIYEHEIPNWQSAGHELLTIKASEPMFTKS